jgi:hypothetical protein
MWPSRPEQAVQGCCYSLGHPAAAAVASCSDLQQAQQQFLQLIYVGLCCQAEEMLQDS